MHDPKFEKEVQQKMEELSFQPSETVWENVEKEIRKDKKRKTPFLWLFLLAGVMLAGGYYTIFHEASVPPVNSPSTSQEIRSSPSPSAKRPGIQPFSTPAGVTEKDHPSKKDISGPAAVVQSNRPTNIPANAPANIPATASAKAKIFSNHRTFTKTTKGREKRDQEESATELAGVKGNKGAEADLPPAKDPATDPVTVPAKDGVVQSLPGGQQSLAGAQSSLKKEIVKTIPPAAKENISISDKRLASRNKQKDIHRWKIGLIAGSGFSAIDRSLFKASSAAELSSFASTFAAYPPGWQTHPSTIRQDISFAGGVFAVRPLTRKIVFSIGLTYHYYSTTVQTGPIVSPSLTANYNAYVLILPGNPMASQQASALAYTKGDESIHTEQYHLLELPVSVQWQFTHIRKLPLYWETGFSISRLIGVNALSFDGTSDTYYKDDNALFGKTQMSISTAFLLGLPVAGHRLQLGPQIQYELSDLLKNNVGNGQHLLFAGIRLAFILGR